MPTNAPKPTRGRPKSIDRAAVVGRAMAHYWMEGLHAASVNELCGHVKISKPGLYREFGGEDGLMDAALELYRERAVLPLLELIGADLSFEDTIDRALVALTDTRARPPGCLFTKMRLNAARLGPHTAKRLSAIVDERLEAFAAFFARASKAGEIDPDLSPKFCAAYLDAQMTLVLTEVAMGEAPSKVRRRARLAICALT